MCEGTFNWKGHKRFAEAWLVRLEHEMANRGRQQFAADDSVDMQSHRMAEEARPIRVVYAPTGGENIGIGRAPRHGANGAGPAPPLHASSVASARAARAARPTTPSSTKSAGSSKLTSVLRSPSQNRPAVRPPAPSTSMNAKRISQSSIRGPPTDYGSRPTQAQPTPGRARSTSLTSPADKLHAQQRQLNLSAAIPPPIPPTYENVDESTRFDEMMPPGVQDGPAAIHGSAAQAGAGAPRGTRDREQQQSSATDESDNGRDGRDYAFSPKWSANDTWGTASSASVSTAETSAGAGGGNSPRHSASSVEAIKAKTKKSLPPLPPHAVLNQQQQVTPSPPPPVPALPPVIPERSQLRTRPAQQLHTHSQSHSPLPSQSTTPTSATQPTSTATTPTSAKSSSHHRLQRSNSRHLFEQQQKAEHVASTSSFVELNGSSGHGPHSNASSSASHRVAKRSHERLGPSPTGASLPAPLPAHVSTPRGERYMADVPSEVIGSDADGELDPDGLDDSEEFISQQPSGHVQVLERPHSRPSEGSIASTLHAEEAQPRQQQHRLEGSGGGDSDSADPSPSTAQVPFLPPALPMTIPAYKPTSAFGASAGDSVGSTSGSIMDRPRVRRKSAKDTRAAVPRRGSDAVPKEIRRRSMAGSMHSDEHSDAGSRPSIGSLGRSAGRALPSQAPAPIYALPPVPQPSTSPFTSAGFWQTDNPFAVKQTNVTEAEAEKEKEQTGSVLPGKRSFDKDLKVPNGYSLENSAPERRRPSTKPLDTERSALYDLDTFGKMQLL